MDALEALKTRRSVRIFSKEPLPKDAIEDIIDCGRLAATARNVQPWAFVAVTDATTRARLASLAVNGPFIADAPVCVAVLCEEGTYYLEDGCAATQNLLVAARAHGCASCWVAGDKKPYADAVLKILGAPAHYKLVSLVALGRSDAHPNPQKRPLADVIHWERF
jgi:nitroreductase